MKVDIVGAANSAVSNTKPEKPYVESSRRSDGWWLIDPNNSDPYREVGPYHTKAEAEDDARGLYRFWRDCSAGEHDGRVRP